MLTCFVFRKANSTQPMVQWSESYAHPGLVFCITQSTNTPLALYITSQKITVQVRGYLCISLHIPMFVSQFLCWGFLIAVPTTWIIYFQVVKKHFYLVSPITHVEFKPLA